MVGSLSAGSTPQSRSPGSSISSSRSTGRVRPYNKYLPWELREHPLPQWDAGELLGLLAATLDGDPSAIRKTFARVESLCTAFDDARSAPLLTPIVLDWGGELRMLRG